MSDMPEGPPGGGWWRRWRRGLRRSPQADSVRETIEDLIEERGDEEASIDEHERRLLANILRLRGVTAHDIMVPRADIVAVDARTDLKALVEIINTQGHTRYPVFRGTLDDATGMLHIKDVLMQIASGKPFSLQRIMRRILFISPSVRVLDLLLEMRNRRTHMALVVDEYGGIDGLVTIEDLVEQITGEIEDEHDEGTDLGFAVRPDGVIEADARVPLAEFEARIGMRLLDDDEREDIDTLGGLVSFLAGRLPARGELVNHPGGIEFEVVDADLRRVKRLRVRNAPPPKDRTA